MELFEYRTFGRSGLRVPEDGLRELDRVSAPDLNYPYPWLASIATPLTQSGTQVNGVGSASCRRSV